jgi:hypothetical protein
MIQHEKIFTSYTKNFHKTKSLYESTPMPDTSIPHSDNTSGDDKVIIDWRGKRIVSLISLRVPQDSDQNSSTSHDTIFEDSIILLTITILSYDDTLFQFGIPLDEQFGLHQVYFQRLRRNDEPHGQEQPFQQVINDISNRGGCVLLCHNTLAWYIYQ